MLIPYLGQFVYQSTNVTYINIRFAYLHIESTPHAKFAIVTSVFARSPTLAALLLIQMVGTSTAPLM